MFEEKKQRLKEYQKNYHDVKNLKQKIFTLFSFHSKKMEQEAIYFGENGIIKSAFHKNKRPINIDGVDIEKRALPDKK